MCTKLTVKLVPVPKVKALAVLAFDTVFDAAAAAAAGLLMVGGIGVVQLRPQEDARIPPACC